MGRSILGYFAHREQAERAKEHLRRAGFETVQVDSLSSPAAGSQQLRNPLTGDVDSLAALTGAAGLSALDEETGDGPRGGGGGPDPLLAADPDASGLAHEVGADPGLPAPAWMVTVVTTEDHVNRAVHILEDAGGIV